MAINDLQKKLIPMLRWFHEFCLNNSLQYYAVGGTFLGAVRHEGFIPWDDDIDIGMPRKDYNKLLEMIGNRKTGHYYLETPESEAPDFRYLYSKLYDTDTTLVENTWPVLKRGIFLDIFPLDGLGNSEEDALSRWKYMAGLSNFMWARTCAVRKERALFKNIVIVLAHLLPGFLFNDRKRRLSLNREAQKYDFNSSEYGGNTFGNWGEKELMPTSIFGEPALYKFEGGEIYGPQDYDAYLTHLYGNWRQLPPKEKQVTHHDYLELDLYKPYM